MTAAEWLKKLVESDEETYMELSDVQAILDDGRVQGMREAADGIERLYKAGQTDGMVLHWCLINKISDLDHANKLAKGKK